MRKFILLLMLSLMAVTASAQITWNAKAGFGVAHCLGNADNLSPHLVGKIGFGIEKPFTPNWSLMPSLEIAWKGAVEHLDLYSDDLGGNCDGNSTLNLFYVQIPVLAAYRLNLNDSWNMTFKAGPYFGVAPIGKLDVRIKPTYDAPGSETYKKDWDYFSLDGTRRFDVGLDLGIDFEYHRFVFGVEYEVGFISLQDSEMGTLYNAAAYATIGYKF